MYYGLQAAGVSPGYAGNYVQLFVVLGLCVGWIGSYIFRVANKVIKTTCLCRWQHSFTRCKVSFSADLSVHYCYLVVQDMTYVKQLQNYEEEVMQKRLEEMPESEREKLMASVEAEKERRRTREGQPK